MVKVTLSPIFGFNELTVLFISKSVWQMVAFKFIAIPTIEPTLPLVAPLAKNSVIAVELVLPFAPPRMVLTEASVIALTEITPPPPPPPGPSDSPLVIN